MNLVKVNSSLVAFALLCFSCAMADASAVQDSCRTTGDYPTVYFSVVNDAPQPVCQVTLFPYEAECLLLDCAAPDGWSCFPGNVTTFWIANSNDACIPVGGSRGFRIQTLSVFCCYGMNLFGGDGTHLGSKDVCFDCHTIGVEPRTWGHVKALFD